MAASASCRFSAVAKEVKKKVCCHARSCLEVTGCTLLLLVLFSNTSG